MSLSREEILSSFYFDKGQPELNFTVYAEELCKAVMRATEWQRTSRNFPISGALTVGIFGSWGSGKTSLMHEIESLLKIEEEKIQQPESNFKYKTIWFNPWKYDGREDLRNALIQTILRSIINDKDVKKNPVKQSEWAQLAKRFGLCTTGISLRLASVAIQSSINIDTKKLSEQIAEEVEEYFPDESSIDSFDPYLFINQFEEGFREAVKAYVGEEGKIIIFIDDLDRCLPSNALTVLESIKLYLDQSNCIFFIGIDKRVVEQAVRDRYQNSSLNVTGDEYIKKIIRLPFFIPEKSPDSIENILQVGLNAPYAGDEERWRIIQMATGSNIRNIKQFVIAFDLIQKIVDRLNMNQSYLPNLAKLLLIQLNYPIFFDRLKVNNGLLKKFEEIFDDKKEFFKIKEYMSEDSDGKIFWDDDSLIKFLIDSRDYPKGFSNPNEIQAVLRMLSQTGGNPA